MTREDLKKAVKDAKERFKKYSTFENLLFICELLSLESEKYGITGQTGISLDIRKIELELSRILEEVF